MSDSMNKVIDLVGSSPESWDKAAANAVERAAKSLRDLPLSHRVILFDLLILLLVCFQKYRCVS